MPFADSTGAEIYFEEQGSGHPLLLIMGLGGTHVGWMAQVRSFRKHFRVISYDARGLGLSRDSGGPYTMRTLADDAVAILDHLGIERSHVLGISLGGMVAQEVAINYPQRVAKLVLAATTPGGQWEISPEMREALGVPEDLDASEIDRNEYAGEGFGDNEVGSAIMRLSFNSPLLPWFLSKVARRQRQPPRAGGVSRQTQASASHDTRDRLHLIESPTLVITGSRDRIIPPHASEVLASRIPNAELQILHGAPHALLIESARRFNRAVLRFLRA
jgi:pimeloyl-ACP methyl ester carboxylesterase